MIERLPATESNGPLVQVGQARFPDVDFRAE